jgi:hypothetical protein
LKNHFCRIVAYVVTSKKIYLNEPSKIYNKIQKNQENWHFSALLLPFSTTIITAHHAFLYIYQLKKHKLIEKMQKMIYCEKYLDSKNRFIDNIKYSMQKIITC